MIFPLTKIRKRKDASIYRVPFFRQTKFRLKIRIDIVSDKILRYSDVFCYRQVDSD